MCFIWNPTLKPGYLVMFVIKDVVLEAVHCLQSIKQTI